MTTTIYGISNCDTVRKTRKWFEAVEAPAEFHDFRKQGLTEAKVAEWVSAVGWEILLNKRGTTWRKLDTETQALANEEQISTLLADNPTLIKRPVVEHAGSVLVGFQPDEYEKFGADSEAP